MSGHQCFFQSFFGGIEQTKPWVNPWAHTHTLSDSENWAAKPQTAQTEVAFCWSAEGLRRKYFWPSRLSSLVSDTHIIYLSHTFSLFPPYIFCFCLSYFLQLHFLSCWFKLFVFESFYRLSGDNSAFIGSGNCRMLKLTCQQRQYKYLSDKEVFLWPWAEEKIENEVNCARCDFSILIISLSTEESEQ